MLKKIKLFIKFLIIKNIDRLNPKRGKINKKGFLIFKKNLQKLNLENDAQELYNQIINSQKIIRKKESAISSQVIHFNDILNFNYKLVNFITPEIISEVRSYLGKNTKLDHAYLGLFFTKKSKKSNISSGFFHHDSVGNRCKLFLPINPLGNQKSPTIYISGTNKISWKFEEHDSNNKKNARLDKLASKYQNNQYSISAEFGDSYLFDTNGIHRGSYNTSDEIRCIIQFEFSKHKSILKGEVGPGTFYMNKDSYDYLNKLDLLRKERVRKNGVNYIHRGLSHRRSLDKLINYLG